MWIFLQYECPNPVLFGVDCILYESLIHDSAKSRAEIMKSIASFVDPALPENQTASQLHPGFFSSKQTMSLGEPP